MYTENRSVPPYNRDVEQAPGVVPRNSVAAAGLRGTNQAMITGGTNYGQTGMGSPGRRPFLPGPMAPPILHPIALQWLKKGFNLI